jgi:hypothetical protein
VLLSEGEWTGRQGVKAGERVSGGSIQGDRNIICILCEMLEV